MRERPLLFRAAKPLLRHQGRPLARRPIFPAASPSRSTWPAPLDQAIGRHLTKPAARPGPLGAKPFDPWAASSRTEPWPVNLAATSTRWLPRSHNPRTSDRPALPRCNLTKEADDLTIKAHNLALCRASAWRRQCVYTPPRYNEYQNREGGRGQSRHACQPLPAGRLTPHRAEPGG